MANGDNGKAYPAEVRLFARGLYLQGNSLSEIARAVKGQFPTARCNAETIRRWAGLEKWDEVKQEVASTVLSRQKTDVLDVLENQSAAYGRMVAIGDTALQDPNLRPRSASEAASILDTGLKGQRAALRDLVALSFVKEIFRIVSEEVTDENVRRRIAVRFKELSERV
jgi:hypothetical protein